jgi:hypothetical protein
MGSNKKYVFVEGRDFLIGEGGDVPSFRRNGRYITVARHIVESGKENPWIEVKTSDDAQAMQYAFRRAGMRTKKRVMDNGLIRVWGTRISDEEREKLKKIRMADKILHKRKKARRIKIGSDDPEQKGVQGAIQERSTEAQVLPACQAGEDQQGNGIALGSGNEGQEAPETGEEQVNG